MTFMNTQKSKKIFVVEDNRMYASMIENHLSQYSDCEINLFYSGEDCLLAFDQNPDVVLLDFHLNVDDDTAKTGFDYLKIIKEKNPEQAVVMLSSMEDVKQVVDLLKISAYDYVLKDDMAFDNLDKVMNNLNGVLSIRNEVKSLQTTVKKQNRRFAWTLFGIVVLVALSFRFIH